MARVVRGGRPVRGSAPRRPRDRHAPRRLLLGVLGVTAIGLIAAGVLLPEPPGGAGIAVDDAASAAAAPATQGGTQSFTGSSAMVVPVPAEPSSPALVVPAPSVRQFQVPRPWVPHGVVPTTSPPPAACGGSSTPRRISPGVTAGTGSATVSWMADGHRDVQGYRIRAVSQRLVSGVQPDPITVPVAQVSGCRPVGGKVGGLDSGVHYVFWLEEGQLDAATGALRYVQVGESAPVLIG